MGDRERRPEKPWSCSLKGDFKDPYFGRDRHGVFMRATDDDTGRDRVYTADNYSHGDRDRDRERDRERERERDRERQRVIDQERERAFEQRKRALERQREKERERENERERERALEREKERALERERERERQREKERDREREGDRERERERRRERERERERYRDRDRRTQRAASPPPRGRSPPRAASPPRRGYTPPPGHAYSPPRPRYPGEYSGSCLFPPPSETGHHNNQNRGWGNPSPNPSRPAAPCVVTMATNKGMSTGLVDNTGTLHTLDQSGKVVSQPAAEKTVDFANQLADYRNYDHTFEIYDQIKDNQQNRLPQYVPRGQSAPNFNYQPTATPMLPAPKQPTNEDLAARFRAALNFDATAPATTAELGAAQAYKPRIFGTTVNTSEIKDPLMVNTKTNKASMKDAFIKNPIMNNSTIYRPAMKDAIIDLVAAKDHAVVKDHAAVKGLVTAKDLAIVKDLAAAKDLAVVAITAREVRPRLLSLKPTQAAAAAAAVTAAVAAVAVVAAAAAVAVTTVAAAAVIVAAAATIAAAHILTTTPARRKKARKVKEMVVGASVDTVGARAVMAPSAATVKLTLTVLWLCSILYILRIFLLLF
ncbi:hypothetical protein TWF173_007962 [Orbilia oligospora]|nr:hypothetical protein TWF173_007962 [Orbilia oligospora]